MHCLACFRLRTTLLRCLISVAELESASLSFRDGHFL
jgi:hypothetical protein